MLWERSVTEQRHNAVLEVLETGLPVVEVAERYGVSRQSVHTWVNFTTCLREDLALKEAEQQAAQLGPDPLSYRDLGQEPGDLAVQGLQVQLGSRVISGHDRPLGTGAPSASAQRPQWRWRFYRLLPSASW